MATERTLTIQHKLGSGLYAEVFLAKDEVLSRKVAVKIIRDDFAQQDSVAVSHARTLSRLQRHPNVVQVYSVGEVYLNGAIEGKFTVIEMEWIDGENLFTKMKGPKFTVPEGRRMCLGIASGILHMHTGEMAHGDLHPGNILVDGDSNPIVIDAANRHNVTAFRTSYADNADLFDQDLRSVKFCMRQVIMHAMFSSTSANELIELLEKAKSVHELVELCQFENNWTGKQMEAAVGTVSGRSAFAVIQLLENNQTPSLRDAALDSINRLVIDATDETVASMDSNVDGEALNARIEYFERVSADAASMLGLIAAWGNDDMHERIELDSFRLLRSQLNTPFLKGPYRKDWETMRQYPLLILFYSSCYAAYRNGRYSFLRHFLVSPAEHRRSLLDAMNVSTIDLEIAWRDIAKIERYTPVSDRIVNLLPGIVPSFALSNQTTADDFDELQVFLSCVLIDQIFPGNLEISKAENVSRNDGLKGRFLWRFERSSHTRDIENYLMSQAEREGVHWGPIRNGFFGGKLDRALQVIEFSKSVHNRLRQAYRIF